MLLVIIVIETSFILSYAYNQILSFHESLNYVTTCIVPRKHLHFDWQTSGQFLL